MVINTNINALNASRNLGTRVHSLQGTMTRLSSGQRINSAADDPAGLAVSQQIKTQVLGLSQAQRNAQDAVSLVQTAEGFLASVTDDLQRLRQISIQAANGVYSQEQRALFNGEVQAILSEVTRVGETAQFNRSALFQTQNVGLQAAGLDGAVVNNGNVNNGYTLIAHIGPNTNTQNDNAISFTFSAVDTNSLGIANVSLETTESANAALASIENALQGLVDLRSRIGAFQNRLISASNTISLTRENLIESNSRILDANIAEEVVDLTKEQILNSASVAVLAQANIQPQSLLRLLA